MSLVLPKSFRFAARSLAPVCIRAKIPTPSSSHLRAFSSNRTNMSPPKIVCSRRLPTNLLGKAAEKGEIQLVSWDYTDKAADRKWLLEQVKGASGIVVMLSDKVDEELINAAGPSLQSISTMSVGYDHITLPLLKEKKIRLGYTPDILNDAVCDLTLLLLLGVTRQLPLGTRLVREGKWGETPWSPLSFSGPSLKGKTIGFLGFGSIAQSLTLRLASFDVGKVIYKASRPRKFDVQDEYFKTFKEAYWEDEMALRRKQGKNEVTIENVDDLSTLASQSDFLIVLASLSPQTKHIISDEILSKMKSTSYLINVSRGPLVDTSALIQALKQGQIAGAGLDVLEGEPNISSSHPLSNDPEVKDKVLLMPHVGSANYETRMEMSQVTEGNVLAGIGLKGRKGVGEMEFEVKM